MLSTGYSFNLPKNLRLWTVYMFEENHGNCYLFGHTKYILLLSHNPFVFYTLVYLSLVYLFYLSFSNEMFTVTEENDYNTTDTTLQPKTTALQTLHYSQRLHQYWHFRYYNSFSEYNTPYTTVQSASSTLQTLHYGRGPHH